MFSRKHFNFIFVKLKEQHIKINLTENYTTDSKSTFPLRVISILKNILKITFSTKLFLAAANNKQRWTMLHRIIHLCMEKSVQSTSQWYPSTWDSQKECHPRLLAFPALYFNVCLIDNDPAPVFYKVCW